MKKILILVFLLALLGCEDGDNGAMGPSGKGGCDYNEIYDEDTKLCITNPDYTPPKDGKDGCDHDEIYDSTAKMCIADANYVNYKELLEKACQAESKKLTVTLGANDAFTWQCI